MKFFGVGLFFMFASSVSAAVFVDSIEQVGAHERLFVFEKNENPQNIMAVYTKLNTKCQFVKADNSAQPVFDFYWLMDGSRFKPVHPMIKSGVRDRVTVDNLVKTDEFSVHLNDLSELKQDLRDAKLMVEVTKGSQGCRVETRMTLGPSDHNRVIQLDLIHTESKKTILPPFRSVVSIRLEGRDVATNEKVSRTYSAK